MSNELGYYNPLFYAQEALIQLRKNLGMGMRVHRGYEQERRIFGRGEYINIRRPSVFTAASAPATAVDLAVQSVQLQLDKWMEVKFLLTDKELSFTSERIIEDHIAPAAYALADDIDQSLAALYKDIPWYKDIAATTVVDDITDTRKVMVTNKVPMQPGRVHFMVGPALEKGLLDMSAFTQHQGAGPQGVADQMAGNIGRRYGFDFFTNQNAATHTAGTCADAAGAIDHPTAGSYAVGSTTIHIDGVTDGGDWAVGDSFVITGNTQRYAVTTAVTFTGGEGDVVFTPPLVAAAADGAVVTGRVDTHTANLAFHQNAFALAMADLPTMGNELGARIVSVRDPVTGLAMRSRVYYVGNSSEVHVALDVLYGVKTLDPNLACRACGA